MSVFSKLYHQVLLWANHKYASWYLAGLSAMESCILPYPPPDILLAPMTLKHPQKGYYFAFITTLFSTIGGIVGYLLGYYFIDIIFPFLEQLGYSAKFSQVQQWFSEYGVLIVFVAGFSPIPYKIFTISAGMMSMAFLPFVLISFVARGLRFYLVAFIVRKYGARCDDFLRKYIDYLGYAIIAFALLFILYQNV